MKRGQYTVTSEQPTRLTRDSLAEIVRALNEPSGVESCSWNVVEALELLVDAGHFSLARRLATRVRGMVADDGRERLFRGYISLCALMEEGTQRDALDDLERLYVEIHHAGHSLADRVRSALLLARAICVCVSMGTLSEGSILRARTVLTVELERSVQAGNSALQVQVSLELAKSYLHAPTSDARAAYSLLTLLRDEIAGKEIHVDLLFDLERLTYQAARSVGGEVATLYPEGNLRNRSLAVGGVARGLAELTIARRNPNFPDGSLESIAELFEQNEFFAGAFEALFTLGSNALDRGHNSSAERYLTRALRVAEQGGFQHGSLLARVGLFQASIIAANLDEAKGRSEAIVSSLTSEVALGAMGLNAAAAQQITGDVAGGLATAKLCERFFKERGILASQSQSAYTVGSCHARMGDWVAAHAAWARAVRLDDEQRAFIQACERRALLVQGLVMSDTSGLGDIRPATITKCEAILTRAYDELKPFGDSIDAKRVRGKLSVVHAQMCVMTKDHVRALRYAAIARECFRELDFEYDVALVDALSGLAMIEVGKGGAHEMFEESVMTLQRALLFFSGAETRRVRWKILYYLAVAALLAGQHKTRPLEKMKWRDLAAGWLRAATDECTVLEREGANEFTAGADSEFSPGLKPKALEALRKALGIGGVSRRKRAEVRVETEAGPGDGYLH
jgi:hypothetical protein